MQYELQATDADPIKYNLDKKCVSMFSVINGKMNSFTEIHTEPILIKRMICEQGNQ